MKKLLAFLLAAAMLLSLASCVKPDVDDNPPANDGGNTQPPVDENNKEDDNKEDEKPEGVMSYADYVAAAIDDEVVIEAYVQAHQSWWDNKVTAYLADEDGAYFVYEMQCSEEDAAKLLPGAKIRVTGYKGEWAGEVEIMDATFVFVESDPWIADAKDLTAVLGTDELINYQNQFVSFNGLTIEKIEFKGGQPGDDIYVTVGYNGQSYSFCVERYLTGPDTDLYAAVSALNVGDTVYIEGFLYWYEGVNTHITGVRVI